MPMSSFTSLVALWHHRTHATPDADAMYGRRGDGSWTTLSWAEAARQARLIACGLHALGLPPQSRCAILCGTRPEWVLIDMGIQATGGVTTTLHLTSPLDQQRHILLDSGARVLFVEGAEAARAILALRAELPDLQQLVCLEAGVEGALDLDGLKAMGERWDREHPKEYRQRADAIRPGDVATLIYTSGTSGPPKGALLSHDAWVFETEAIDKLGLIGPSDKHYLFLPLAHAFARVLEFAFIRAGTPTVLDGDPDDLMGKLQATSPTVLAAVPQVFDEVRRTLADALADAGPLRRAAMERALALGREVSALRQRGREPSGLLAVQHRLADRTLLAGLRGAFGGRVRWFISGGAPLSRDVAEFFHAVGLLVLEGYGLTESAAASFVNRPERYRLGTVGQALPGVAARIAEDGEVLLGGRGLMLGYHGRPEDTAEVLPGDGWLRTGDLGALDADGFLRITGRKKDLIITSSGRSIAPRNIEARLTARGPYLARVVLHGDRRPFLSALVVLDAEAVGAWARARGLPAEGLPALIALPEVQALVRAELEAVNEGLSPGERVRAFALLDHDLDVEGGDLTPKGSLRRQEIERRYAELLDALYDGDPPPP